jgi:hypothetical protein
MKLMKLDVSQALSILDLQIVKNAGVVRVLTRAGIEVTVADADQSIRESQEWLALAEQSPLAGGAQYAHIKNISAWTVVKPYLKTEES